MDSGRPSDSSPAASPHAPANPPRYNVIGVGVSALTLADATALLVGARAGSSRGHVCCGTAYGLVLAQHDGELRHSFNSSWLTTPDGMPLVWLGPPGVGRVYGPDLMLAVCDAGRSHGLKHYFFGGLPGVAEALREQLCARFPGLQVVGAMTPPFRPLETAERVALRADVARLRPDIVWVGLGTPKQEKFMAAHGRELPTGALVGVGAAFDFLSGRVRQAPRWIRGSGFEWLFRFCMEPRRLGWRYLKTNPLFVAHVLMQKVWPGRYGGG